MCQGSRHKEEKRRQEADKLDMKGAKYSSEDLAYLMASTPLRLLLHGIELKFESSHLHFFKTNRQQATIKNIQ